MAWKTKLVKRWTEATCLWRFAALRCYRLDNQKLCFKHMALKSICELYNRMYHIFQLCCSCNYACTDYTTCENLTSLQKSSAILLVLFVEYLAITSIIHVFLDAGRRTERVLQKRLEITTIPSADTLAWSRTITILRSPWCEFITSNEIFVHSRTLVHVFCNFILQMYRLHTSALDTFTMRTLRINYSLSLARHNF